MPIPAPEIQQCCRVILCFCVCRITAAGQIDKRDSVGVCVDKRSDAESLQRDQAVCISTNGRSDPL